MTDPFHRDERIKYACKCLSNDNAVNAFNQIASLFPQASIFYDDEECQAEIVEDGFSITITGHGKGC